MPVTVRGTDILFNDSSTQSTAAVVNTTNVLNATAGASLGAVGTYAWLRPANFNTYTENSTLAGSSLRYQGAITTTLVRTAHENADGAAPAGTWRAMGRRQAVQMNSLYDIGPSESTGTLWLRIS